MDINENRSLTCRPIGYIHSPYHSQEETPNDGSIHPEVEGRLEILEEFEEAMTGMEAGRYYMVLFWFDRSEGYRLVVPHMGNGTMKGLFATHGPHRPNPIGVSTIMVNRIEGRNIYFSGVDMMDGTPVLDIKSGRLIRPE